MNKLEAAKVLTIASGFDNRSVDDVTASAWSIALADVTFDDARHAVLAHVKDPATRHAYLTVGHILDRVEVQHRLSRSAIEADVRVAKQLGLVEASWPGSIPLVESVASELANWRARQAADAAAAIAAPIVNPVPFELGVALRGVPHE